MNSAISEIILIFLIIDSIGNLPIFMSILKNIDPKRRQIIIIREMIVALSIMLIFLLTGEYILLLCNLKTEAISISGGIILFFISIKMIFPNKEDITNNFSFGEEPFLVPLAIPLIAGPSVLSTLITLSHKHSNQIHRVYINLLISWSLSVCILLLSNIFFRLLGNRGVNVLERIMGIILIMISIQTLLDSFRIYFN